jgi:hypothetical protein
MLTNADVAPVQAQIIQKFPQYANYIHGDTFQVNGTIAASAGSYAAQSASIGVDGTFATSQPVPQSQVWLFTDLYNRTTTDTPTDGLAQIIKNGIKNLANTAPLSTNLVTNQTRPGLQAPFYFEPNAKLTVNTLPIAANGTTVVTDTFFFAVIIYDSSYS